MRNRQHIIRWDVIQGTTKKWRGKDGMEEKLPKQDLYDFFARPLMVSNVIYRLVFVLFEPSKKYQCSTFPFHILASAITDGSAIYTVHDILISFATDTPSSDHVLKAKQFSCTQIHQKIPVVFFLWVKFDFSPKLVNHIVGISAQLEENLHPPSNH